MSSVLGNNVVAGSWRPHTSRKGVGILGLTKAMARNWHLMASGPTRDLPIDTDITAGETDQTHARKYWLVSDGLAGTAQDVAGAVCSFGLRPARLM
jgi:hypothetical protein